MGRAKNQDGFTLVELAIVLMIIGLLIGGILRGQELMSNARISTTVQQINAYSGAVTAFRDAYNSIPGDMASATTRLPNCTTASSCSNGNGDGIIGDLGGSNAGQPWIDIPNGIATENTQFWKHLAATHMISGVSPGASVPEWGRSHPIAKTGGGFFVRVANMAGSGGQNGITGHILVMRTVIDGTWACGGAGNGGTTNSVCAISPQKAAQIDRKMDDGLAFSGDAIAVSANYTSGCGIAAGNGPSGYTETQEISTCDMMFHLF